MPQNWFGIDKRPVFIDSFNHYTGFDINSKYGEDTDPTVFPPGTTGVSGAFGAVIDSSGGQCGGGALGFLVNGGFLRKRFATNPIDPSIGIVFKGPLWSSFNQGVPFSASGGGCLNFWSLTDNDVPKMALQWVPAVQSNPYFGQFHLWGGAPTQIPNGFHNPAFFRTPSIQLNPLGADDEWNYLVWGQRYNILGVLVAILIVNGVTYFDEVFITPGVAAINNTFLSILGTEILKVDDLWMVDTIADANFYPTSWHIKVHTTDGDGDGLPSSRILFDERVPAAPELERWEYVTGRTTPDVNTYLRENYPNTGSLQPAELFHVEDTSPQLIDRPIIGIQFCHLMRGIDALQFTAYGMDSNGSPSNDHTYPIPGLVPHDFAPNNPWLYYTTYAKASKNNSGFPELNPCLSDPGHWCVPEFDPSQFGVSINNITPSPSGFVDFAHQVIEVFYNGPPICSPPSPDTPTELGLTEHIGFTKLWKITRKDNVAFHFTDHNADLINPIDSLTYTPLDSLATSAHQRKKGIDPNNIELRGIIGTMIYNDFLAGKFIGARITEYLLDWRYPWAGVFLITTFYMGATGFSAARWTSEGSSLSLPLLQPKGEIYGRTCRYILGDARCKVDLLQLEQTSISVTTIVEGFDKTQFTCTTSEGNDAFGNDRATSGYFDFGNITWISGNNNGLKSEVRTHVGSTTLTLQIPLPFNIVAGDTFNIVPGCNKLYTTCKDKFENSIDGDVDCGNTKNFGGFPTIPGADGVFAPITGAIRIPSGDFLDDPFLGRLLDFFINRFIF